MYERALYNIKEDADIQYVGDGTLANSYCTEYERFVDVGEAVAASDVFTQPGHTLCYIRPTSTSPPSPPPLPGVPPPAPGPVPHLLPMNYNVPRVFPQTTFTMRWCRLPAEFCNAFLRNPWTDRMNGTPAAGLTPAKLPYFGTINKNWLGIYPPGTLRLKKWRPIRRPAPFVLWFPPDAGGQSNTTPVYVAPAVEFDIELEFHFDPNTHVKKWYNDPPKRDGSRLDSGASGLYFVGAGAQYYDIPDIPDNFSLANVRDFRHFFDVRNLT